MSRRPRRNHTGFRWRSPPSRAIEHWAQLAEQFDVHPNQITSWKAQLEGRAADVFGPGGKGAVPTVGSIIVLCIVWLSLCGLRQVTQPCCGLGWCRCRSAGSDSEN